jgi:hypothetical protein
VRPHDASAASDCATRPWRDTQTSAVDPPFGELGACQLSVQVQPYPVCGPDAYADPWVAFSLAICCQSEDAATSR